MAKVNTAAVIADAREELRANVASRDSADKRISELRGLLRALVGLVEDETERVRILDEIEAAKRKTPSLMSVVTDVLMQHTAGENKEGLSANQIRDIIELSGFDLEDYSQPLAAIMTALGRLIEQKKATRYQSKSQGILFKWILHDLYTSGMRGNEKPKMRRI